RIIMRQKPKRIAAGIAVALLLAGLFGLGSGSVAFSQARHAVNSTLSRLKAMITGDTDMTDMPPELEATPAPDGRQVVCSTRFFSVPPAERDIGQRLKDQGIELIQASADPEVYYAAISRQQAASFDVSLTLKCVAAPRVTVLEGETATFAMTDRQAARGLALAWQPTVSDDGTEIQSTLSVHDGSNGFEIPNIATEPGGVVLILAVGVFFDPDDAGEPLDSPHETLIQVQVDLEQTP
ncbi:MAG: hypothetical protein ACM3VT_16590, partial [Solirubrobacterales bacterium]